MAEQSSAWLTIDLGAIRRNCMTLARQAVGAECAAVIKADAYGVGMAPVARTLAPHVTSFFVAHAQEGQELRTYLPDARIFVLHGFLPGNAVFLRDHALIPVLNTLAQVREWQILNKQDGKRYPAALQFDTGMSRFGLSIEECNDPVCHEIAPVLVMSHLACADIPDHPANKQQRERFLQMTEYFPGVPRSLAASSGIFLGPDYHFEMVRPGAGLYGIAPNDQNNPLEPVVTLTARIQQAQRIPKGTSVGYGLTWNAPQDTTIATVGIGYADGFFRSLADRGVLWYASRPLPVVGRVSMDSVSIDISAVTEKALETGDEVTVIGPQQSLDAFAKQAGTIAYEILTALGQRFARIYCDSGET